MWRYGDAGGERQGRSAVDLRFFVNLHSVTVLSGEYS